MQPAEKNNTEKPSAYAISATDPAASVFVSANAGAGKTTLLTGRVLSLLLHGVLPSKILCLTFTNAAAAEMSNRVLRELGRWVMMGEAELTAELMRILGAPPDRARMARARSLFALVLEAPEGIRIQTIHGFCQSLLRRFPLEADISPHFSVMEARTEQEMLAEARIRLLGRARAEDPALQSSIHALAEALSETSLQELLAQIVKQKRAFLSLLALPGGREGAAEAVWKALGVAPDASLPRLVAKYFTYEPGQRETLKRAAEALANGKKNDMETSQALEQWLSAPVKNIIAYCERLLTKEGTIRKTLFTQHLKNPALIEALQAEQERAFAFHHALRSLDVAEATAHLLRVAEALLAIYDSLKCAYGRMDYDDLILQACALLERPGIAPWVLFKLDGGIDHVLVDEAQDTSPEQWRIIQSLTQEFFAGLGRSEQTRSLFVVGDEKQSIYSFQGADVKALGEMQRYFTRRIEDAGERAHRISLTHSYRSTTEILTAVDAIFARPEARAGLMFEEGALTHIPTRGSQPGLVELWPLVTVEEDSPISPNLQLARQLADRIQAWREEGVNPGDIMILVRKRTGFVDQLVRALKRRDVPVAGIDRMVLGDNLAVQDLLALAQAALLPEDDLTLAALLKSPIIGLSEEALYTLAYDRKGSLWEALGHSEPCRAAYTLLHDIRAKADYITPFELFSYALDTLGARKHIIGRMGEEYADPIDEFLAQTLLYERSHTPSLQGFLHWMQTSSSEIKRDMEQARGSVRIMTVHAAKGLQAPIVILPDTTQPPMLHDTMLWENALPFWPKSSTLDDAHCAKLRAAKKQVMLEEYRRLFYVALTRAEDQLYIVGAARKEKVSEESWYALAKAGLEPVAQYIAMETGEGLRLGNPAPCHPERSRGILLPGHEEISLGYARDDKTWNFLSQPAPEEPLPPRPLAPSRLPGEEPAAASPLDAKHNYQRGKLIHRLLQLLPAYPPEERETRAQRMAAPPDVIGEVMAVMNDPAFAFLFSKQAMAEVPLAGTVSINGITVSLTGQIDRLAIGEDTVWIVDFKSGTATADIPTAYRRQLALYQRLLADIYPQKTIRCALLWTANATMAELTQQALDEALASAYIIGNH